MLLSSESPSIVAMIHLDALPGTPGFNGSPKKIMEKAIREAEIYVNSGVDAILIENMHDIPYLNRNVGPEITAMMAVVGSKIREITQLPTGIQILAGANKAALAAAFAGGLDFIRAEGFVFGHLADEGWMNSDAGELLRYRKAIGADTVQIWTDIKKKHASHAISSDIDLVETAQAAAFFKSDGLIITGPSTGVAAEKQELERVFHASRLPIIIGSGITADNLSEYWDRCHGMIIGSFFKENGQWQQAVSRDRVEALMTKVRLLRA